jgi:hypothetical protein
MITITNVTVLPCINKFSHDEEVRGEPNLARIMGHMKMQGLGRKEACSCTIILAVNLFHVTIEKRAKRMFRKLEELMVKAREVPKD